MSSSESLIATSLLIPAVSLEGDNAVTEPQIQWALTATIALTLVCIVFVRPVRQKAYEVFIISHFLLVLCVFPFFHLPIATDDPAAFLSLAHTCTPTTMGMFFFQSLVF